VDLAEYDYLAKEEKFEDADLDDQDTIKFGYIGSIRYVNNIDFLLDAAKLIKTPRARIIIWGRGSEREAESIKNRIKDEKISNVVFKGYLDRKYVPYASRKLDVGLVCYRHRGTDAQKYGTSQNKSFDYLAAGIPVIKNIKEGFSKYERFQCGICDDLTAQGYAEEIDKFCVMQKDEFEKQCQNARMAAEEYDFKRLTEKLIDVIGASIRRYSEREAGLVR